jgi:hypothetical protein
MPRNQPHEIAASTAQRAQVVVAVLAGPDVPAISVVKDLRRWRRLTPLASWTTVKLRGAARAEILCNVTAALEQQYIPAHRLILVGEGIAAQRVLELVLQGALVCAGLLAIDIPCTPLPFHILSTAAAIRLVVQCDGSKGAFDDFVHALQAADIDERIITINPTGRRDPRVAASAAETFILELVATVGRQAHYGGRTDEIQDT